MSLTRIGGTKMNWKDNLRYKYNTASILEKFIAINIVMFVLTFAFNTIGFLFGSSGNNLLIEWLVFPKDLSDLLFKPWSILTYAFLHASIFHILSNMIVLYFSGQIFLNFYNRKKFVNFYILGAIFGALIFALSYNLFPAFQGTGKSYLIGASASVMAILVGIATKIPNFQVRLMFLGNLKLWWIAAGLVALDFIQIPFGNPGGHLAHLGGAAIGYLYTKQLEKGNDIGSWIESSINYISDFSFSSKSNPKMKTVYKNKQKKTEKKKSNLKDKNNQEKIDKILDKISSSGYGSLTKEEKDFLFRAGKDL
ncbi:rhomboid family intramembrane serine protease [Psychroflexus halocasei]|uniref:Membrane associated serine protease, rhomboid family n=1 Tax=Psychroflexus halocasei TaxID=908615 RepID=A0A1H3YJK1_9FLAO|nr:rhomboid family intramembrane serine protease [Psychroflexus halocasei]SEA11799.1 Membrane associated serine protease, rhomboid family [Psychroflexus halocasei]